MSRKMLYSKGSWSPTVSLNSNRALEAAKATSTTDRGVGEFERIPCCPVLWMSVSPSATLGQSRLFRTAKRLSG